MSWVKLDDSMPDHPKVVGLCDRAFRVHVTGISYCARHLTDGEIPEAVGRSWGTRYVRELVLANLWHETDSGWEIHDYLDYNPSRKKVMAEREAKAKAGAKGAATRWSKHTDSSVPSPSHPSATGNSMPPSRPVPVPDKTPSKARDPNPNQPSQDQLYLAEQLGEAWGTDFSVKRIVLLNKMHGRSAVEDAMRELHGFPPEAGIRDLFAYITKTCELRANA